MWQLILGVPLTLLPERWRSALRLEDSIPWAGSAIISGLLESMVGLLALVYWYSRSVTTWAATALDSALRGGPEKSVPGQAIGFSALVLWMMHPLTWVIGYFVFEGVVRMLAGAITEQTFGTLPLAILDWCYGKLAGRAVRGDAVFLPSGRDQVRAIASGVREKVAAARSQDIPDEVIESAVIEGGGDSMMEIPSCRPKEGWTPPRTVRIGDCYFRLEHAERSRGPRPYSFTLRRLAAGVPGRTVIVYDDPRHVKGEVPAVE
jgi:hypothetical protein